MDTNGTNPVIDFKYDMLLFSPRAEINETFIVVFQGERKLAYALQNGTYRQITNPGQYDNYGRSAGDTMSVIKDNNYGLINPSGILVVETSYSSLDLTTDGGDLYIGKSSIGSAVFNSKGKKIFSTQYDIKCVQYMMDGTYRFIVSEQNQWGVSDAKGNLIIPLKYKSLQGEGDYIIAQDPNGNFGVFNKEGGIAIPFIYNKIDDAFPSRGNLKAEIVSCGTYDEVYLPGASKLLRIKQDGKYGFIDLTEKVTIPPIYDDASDTGVSGLIAVRKGDKFGFINDKNQVILPIEYDYVNQFSNGVALVVKDGKCGYIDTKGKLVVPLIYDFNGQQTKVIGLTDAYLIDDTYGKNLVLPVNKDGKWGAIKILQPTNLSD